MTVLVSILITDLIPLRDVAQWRSYVNIVATTGRSLGGPLGGWLADVVGWRWSFFGQVPVIILSIVLCAVALPDSRSKRDSEPQEPRDHWQQLQRIDFKGTVVFTLMILLFLLPTELGGKHFPWTHPLIPSLFAGSIGLLALFVWVEKRAAEPIIPLEIFHNKDAVLSYAVTFLQTGAQVGVCISPCPPPDNKR
jgi:MFS family permease